MSTVCCPGAKPYAGWHCSGMTAAAATALIAACGENKTTTSNAPVTSSGAATSSAPPPGSAKALPTTPITWAGPQGELQAAWAEAPNARGGILVIHENKGLNDWVRSVAGRFAGIGYSALAIDLLSGQGGTAKFTDPAQATAALGQIPPEEFVANLKSGVDELARRVPGKKLAVVGFCMGGGLAWQLLAAGEPRAGRRRSLLRACSRRSRLRRFEGCLRCLASTARWTSA